MPQSLLGQAAQYAIRFQVFRERRDGSGRRYYLELSGRNGYVIPAYGGKAKTVHEYVVESVLEPGVFVVPGYPPETMPTWYGAKLSALALEKIAAYLEQQGTAEDSRKQ